MHQSVSLVSLDCCFFSRLNNYCGLLLPKVEDILGDAANLFKDHFYIKPSGNCDLSRMSDPHDEFKGKNVLIEREDLSTLASKLGMYVDQYSDILGQCRQKLFVVRSNRPRPHLDDKVCVPKL